jgi:imidazolonepropionase-like amidohydrolase
MKTSAFRPFAAILVVLLVSRASDAQQDTPRTVAFVDVNLVPMDTNRIVPHQTVIVRGDRIAGIAPAAETVVPGGTVRIEGNGRFLIPGFGEMHGHNPALDASPEWRDAVFFLFVANGVTTVRSMLGWPGQLELRDQVATADPPGPYLQLAGPSFSGASIQSPEQAMRRVREQQNAGWDLLKVHPGLRLEHYDAMVRTAREVGIPFAGHVPADVGIVRALESGQQTIDHLDGYIEYLQGDRGELDPARLRSIVRLTRERGAWVIPTMMLWETIIGAADLEKMLAYDELKYVPRSQVEQWKQSYERRIGSANFDRAAARRVAENRKVLLKALHEGGVKILFGTDAPQQFSVPGFSIHREMRAMMEAGVPLYEVLRSATKNVGDYLSEKDRFGIIAEGSRADLVLLEGNPLDDIGNVSRRGGVMVRGHWIPEEQIQRRLTALADYAPDN